MARNGRLNKLLWVEEKAIHLDCRTVMHVSTAVYKTPQSPISLFSVLQLFGIGRINQFSVPDKAT